MFFGLEYLIYKFMHFLGLKMKKKKKIEHRSAY